MWEHELGYHYANAADAPRIVQIVVAEHGYQEGGAWGCIKQGSAGEHP